MKLKTLYLAIISLFALNTQAQELTEYDNYFEQESKKSNPEATFGFNIKNANHTFKYNHPEATLIMSVEKISDWQNNNIAAAQIVSDLKKHLQTISSTDTVFADSKSIKVKLLGEDKTLISQKNRIDGVIRHYQVGSNLQRVKSGIDTFELIYDNTASSNNSGHPISILLLINDYQHTEKLPWDRIENFLTQSENVLVDKGQKWVKPNAPAHQLKGYYIDEPVNKNDYWVQSNKYVLKDYTLRNRLFNRLFINANLGVYSGVNVPIGFILDASISYILRYNKNNTLSFIGLNTGILTPSINNNTITSNQYWGVEFGTIKRNQTISLSPKASFVIGIYNSSLDNEDDVFKPVPYLGINMPLVNNIQVTLHMASRLSFNTSQMEEPLRNYLFGISLKTNISVFFGSNN